MRRLVWRGHSSDSVGLALDGTFTPAAARDSDVDPLAARNPRLGLAESAALQWDEEHLARRQGRFERLNSRGPRRAPSQLAFGGTRS